MSSRRLTFGTRVTVLDGGAGPALWPWLLRSRDRPRWLVALAPAPGGIRHEHLRKIDEPRPRADAVVTSTTSSVALCVADAAASREPDPSIRPIVDAFVKHHFDYTR